MSDEMKQCSGIDSSEKEKNSQLQLQLRKSRFYHSEISNNVLNLKFFPNTLQLAKVNSIPAWQRLSGEAAVSSAEERSACGMSVKTTEEDRLMSGRQPLLVNAAAALEAGGAAPEAGSKAAYVIFFLLGLSTLFPWNTFISLPQYFDDRLSAVPDLQALCSSVFAALYNVSTLGTLFLATRYQQMYTPRSRVLLAFTLQIMAFVVITTCVFYPDMNPKFFFALHCGLIVVAGFGTGVLQGALFGFSAQLPGKFTGALMSGQGLAGIVVSGASFLGTAVGMSDASSGTDKRLLPALFFGMSVLTLFLCTAAYLVMERLPFIAYYRQLAGQAEEIQRGGASEGLLDGALLEVPAERIGIKLSDVCRVAKDVARPGLTVLGVFFVTLSIFPAIVVHISAHESGTFFETLFVPFALFSFNVFDTIGRSLPAKVSYGGDIKHVWKWVLARSVFLPLFLLCSTCVAPCLTDSLLPTWFESGYWSMLFMVVFALTNGYLSTIMMIHGPSQAKAVEDQEVAGTAMALYLSVGLALGGTSSLAWAFILGSNEP
jgi:equilibrative nucleoside transporter 1/2/3